MKNPWEMDWSQPQQGAFTIGSPDPFKAASEERAQAAEARAQQDQARETATAPFEARKAEADAITAEARAVEAQRELEAGGGPEAQKRKLWAARGKARNILDTLNQMREKVSGRSTGLMGQVFGEVGGTDALDLQRLADPVVANLAFDRLQEMREQSKTGGALGAVSERELALLSSSVASLDIRQSPEQLLRNIDAIEKHYKRFVLSLEGVNPDDFKFDPFDLKTPEEARGIAQGMIARGETEEAKAFLNAQSMKFDPKQVEAASGKNNVQVIDAQPSVGLGIQKGLEHVGSRAVEGVEGLTNAVLGTDFNVGDQWRESMQDRFGNRYVDPSGETLGRFVGAAAGGLPLRSAALGGAVGELLMGDSRDPMGLAQDAGRGALFGKAFDEVYKGAAGLLAPEVSQSVRNLDAAGVRMSPGQIMGGNAQRAENLRTTLPFAGSRIEGQMDQSFGDFQHALADRSLAPIGQQADRTIPPGHATVKDVRQRVSQEYDDALDGVSLTLDPRLGSRIVSQLGKKRMRPEAAAEVGNVVETTIANTFNGRPTISGREWKEMDSELGKLVEDYRKQGGPMRQAANAVREIKRGMFGGLLRQNRSQAPRVRQADEAFRLRRVLSDAATKDGASGVASPNQILISSRKADPFGKTAFSEGAGAFQDLAGDAQDVLPSGFANSRTADRGIAAAPATREGMIAHAQGALLSPLYTEPVRRGFQSLMLSPRSPAVEAIGRGMKGVSQGVRGMLGSQFGTQALGIDQTNEDLLKTYRSRAW